MHSLGIQTLDVFRTTATCTAAARGTPSSTRASSWRSSSRSTRRVFKTLTPTDACLLRRNTHRDADSIHQMLNDIHSGRIFRGTKTLYQHVTGLQQHGQRGRARFACSASGRAPAIVIVGSLTRPFGLRYLSVNALVFAKKHSFWRKPLPCTPAAETALHPMNWCQVALDT